MASGKSRDCNEWGLIMDKKERVELIHALMAASNAFYKTLKERGYYVSYGLGEPRIGSIRKLSVPAYDNWSLGDLSIVWKLKDETPI